MKVSFFFIIFLQVDWTISQVFSSDFRFWTLPEQLQPLLLFSLAVYNGKKSKVVLLKENLLLYNKKRSASNNKAIIQIQLFRTVPVKLCFLNHKSSRRILILQLLSQGVSLQLYWSWLPSQVCFKDFTKLKAVSFNLLKRQDVDVGSLHDLWTNFSPNKVRNSKT